MTDEADRHKVLYIIVCAAGPAGDVGKLVTLAHQRGWDVQIIATPSALDFIDAQTLEAQTGRPVRSHHRKPGEPRSPKADAIIMAPATYNTINKWANGISDTYALGILAEAPGLGIPVVVLPFINSALATRRAFQNSINTLRDEGVRILLGPREFAPHDPGTGETFQDEFPWPLAMDEGERLYASPPRPTTSLPPVR
ncbi:flavoprotein [Spirillospora sp. NPDC047418]